MIQGGKSSLSRDPGVFAAFSGILVHAGQCYQIQVFSVPRLRDPGVYGTPLLGSRWFPAPPSGILVVSRPPSGILVLRGEPSQMDVTDILEGDWGFGTDLTRCAYPIPMCIQYYI